MNEPSLLEHEELLDPSEYEAPPGPAEPADPAAPAPEGEKKPPEEAAAAKELRQARADLKRERDSRIEAERASQYWQGQTRDGQRGPQPVPRAEEPEEDVDLVDLITKDGAKGFNKYLDKRLEKGGFVKKEEMDRRIAQERSTIQYEASLLRQYPELEDDDSPLFVQTKKEYAGLLKDDPGLARSPATMRIAAKLAAAAIKGKPARAAAPESEDDYEEEPPARRARREEPVEEEDDRVRRVASQQVTRGRRPASDRAPSDDLSPMQKSLVARMREAGANITEEGYKKRANAGVAMSGLPSRRGNG